MRLLTRLSRHTSRIASRSVGNPVLYHRNLRGAQESPQGPPFAIEKETLDTTIFQTAFDAATLSTSHFRWAAPSIVFSELSMQPRPRYWRVSRMKTSSRAPQRTRR